MTTFNRVDGRVLTEKRPVEVILGFQKNPEGSVLYRCGGTRVLISASVEESVPPFLRGTGKGWVTAEYAMHPRANPNRQERDGRRGKVDGRSQEIQRLIGRSLRAAVNTSKLGERSIAIDCDVLDADGGTRTASITGGFIALALALSKLQDKKLIGRGVLTMPVAAISAGLVGEHAMVDLSYPEDAAAIVDLNVVATPSGDIVEVQGTSEGHPVPKASFDQLIDLGLASIAELSKLQREALSGGGVDLDRLL